ncbi:hypothetical protein U9M48_021170 [Paspalum notatum var. saurae]|uniref:Uncharacterized protein n=1 Tax=Paspalum notatum var. saurae TaxID=547442 RepID=A0AAQ3TIZ9_PASNO
MEMVAYKVEVWLLHGVALVQRQPPCQELMLKPHRPSSVRGMLLQHPELVQHLAAPCQSIQGCCGSSWKLEIP